MDKEVGPVKMSLPWCSYCTEIFFSVLPLFLAAPEIAAAVTGRKMECEIQESCVGEGER